MKTIILLLVLVVCFSTVQAQQLMKKDVPVAVTSVFDKMHLLAKDVDWVKQGKNYEAKYSSGKRHEYVTYDSLGMLLKTEVKIAFSQLPIGVIKYMKKNHKAHKLEEASKVTDSKGVVTYETEMNKMDLIFDAKGNYIKSIKD